MTGVEQVGEAGRFRQRFLIAFVFSSALVVIGTVGFALASRGGARPTPST